MKKLIFALLCLFAVTFTQAYALDAEFDSDTQTAKISGTATAGETLAIVITDADVSDLKNATASLMKTHSIGFYEVNADEKGEYSLSFKLDKANIPCNVFVAGVTTSGSTSITNLLDKFNEMMNKVQVRDLITKLQKEVAGDEKIYDKYFGLKKTDTIDTKVYNEKPYESLEKVYEVFEKAVKNYKESSGSSGGGGGGGGSGMSAVLPNVNAQKEQIPVASAQTFADVASDFWGYEAIEALYKDGIVSGVSETEFAPNQSVRREEFVKMLVALVGLDTTGAVDTFADTDKNAWYSPYLAVAQDCGLAYGKEDGSFGVGEILTRQDMAVLASRVLSTTERGTAPEFADEYEIANYAKNSVEILCGLKIMNGVGDGMFAPKETATRAQAAKVIYEIAKLIK